MVCCGVHKRHIVGCGMVDDLMKNFTYEKCPGERHAYSFDPNHMMIPYNFF